MSADARLHLACMVILVGANCTAAGSRPLPDDALVAAVDQGWSCVSRQRWRGHHVDRAHCGDAPAQQMQPHSRSLQQAVARQHSGQELSADPLACGAGCIVSIVLAAVCVGAIVCVVAVCCFLHITTPAMVQREALQTLQQAAKEPADDAAKARAEAACMALVKPMSGDAASSSVECPVCLDTSCDMMLPCGHGCCRKCIENLINCEALLTACPLCRRRLLETIAEKTTDSRTLSVV